MQLSLPNRYYTFSRNYISLLLLFISGFAHADITSNKSFDPTAIIQSETSVLTIFIINSSGVPTLNTTIVDLLPVEVRAVQPLNITNGCGGSVTVTDNGGRDEINLTGGTIPAFGTPVAGMAGECQIMIDVTSAIPGNHTNTILAGDLNGTTGGVAETNADPASATLQVTPADPISGTKSFDPNLVGNGGISQLTIRLDNTNDFDLTGATLVDDLPGPTPGMIIATPANIASTCAAVADITAVAGSNQLSMVNGAIPANGSCTITVDVEAIGSGSGQNTVTNTVPAGTVTTDQLVTNTVFSGNLNILNDIRISKIFNPFRTPVNATNIATFTIQNPFSFPVNFNVSDQLPAGLDLFSPPAPDSTCTMFTDNSDFTSEQIAFTGQVDAALPDGTFGECILQFRVTSNTAGRFNNPAAGIIASATNANTAAPVGIIRTGGTVIFRELTNSVEFEKEFINPAAVPPNPPTIPVGGTATLRITVTNGFNVNINDVTFTDNLPTGFTIAGPVTRTSCFITPGNEIDNTQLGSTSYTFGPDTVGRLRDCIIDIPVLAVVPSIEQPGDIWTNTIPGDTLTWTQGGVGDSFPDDVSDTIRVSEGLLVDKTFSGSLITPGGLSRLTITIRNPQTGPLTNLSFVDVLSDTVAGDITVASPANATNSCNGTLTANPGDAQIELAGGSIQGALDPANLVFGTCIIEVDVTATSLATETNTIATDDVTTDEGITNGVDTVATLEVLANVNVEVRKEFDPEIVGAGESTLTVTINNPNVTSALTDLAFVDNFPMFIELANDPAPVTDCTDASIIAMPGADNFSASGFSLPPGGSCTVSVQTLKRRNGTLTNTIPAGAVTSREGATSPNPASASISGLSPPTVLKSFTPATIMQGEPSLLTLTILNPGTSTLNSIALVDVLPPEMFFTDSPAPATTCTNGVVTAEMPAGGPESLLLAGAEIPSAESCTVTVNVTSATVGTFTNTVPTGALTSGGASTNNDPASADLTVTPGKDLAITKTNPTPLVAGEAVEYMIVVSNEATINVIGASVTDIFGPELLNVSWVCAVTTGTADCDNASAGGGPGASGTGDIALTNVDLAAGASITITVSAIVDPDVPAGDLVCTATVAPPAGMFDFNPDNDEAEVTGTIVNEIDLSITKDDGVTTYVPGAPINYTIVVNNAGPSTATDSVVSTTLPPEFLNPMWSCTASAGASCTTATTAGSIVDTVSIPSGGTLTYTLTGNVSPTSTTSPLECSAAVDADTEQTDTDTSNNSATDANVLDSLDMGDAPDTYSTLLASGGPGHVVVVGAPLLGTCVDNEADGQPSVNADGDDTAVGGTTVGTCTANDDEDGITFTDMVVACGTSNIDVAVSQTPGILNAWIDFNGNGDFTDPADQVVSNQALGVGDSTLTIDVPCDAVTQATSYARFRISTAGGDGPTGIAIDGEIEDHAVTIKGLDLGDNPDSFGTTIALGGPQHILDPAVPLFLGACVDNEADGQPVTAGNPADGDDTDPGLGTLGTCAGNDDEDGVVFNDMLVACNDADVSVNASQAGVLNAWIDFNANGNFTDAADQIATDLPLAAGINVITVGVPCDAVLQETGYARFRVSSAGGDGPGGQAMDGEVEDYDVTIKGIDLGDNPDSFGTTIAAGGAQHAIDPALPVFLGACVDSEIDGQPVTNGDPADGDDLGAGIGSLGTCAGTDDEDGVVFNDMLVACGTSTLDITASQAGVLGAWIDFNADGDFDAADQVFTNTPLTAGVNNLSIDVPCDVQTQAVSYARFRIADAAGDVAGPTGSAMSGEVEDYNVVVKGLDMGDNPNSYGTTVAADGARHIQDPDQQIFLGACVDSEAEGAQSPDSTGDDATAGLSSFGTCAGSDDEDGVVFGSTLIPDSINDDLQITLGATSEACILNAWIDFDENGLYDLPAEQVINELPLATGSGVTTVSITVPPLLPTQDPAGVITSGRFRCSAAGGDGPSGLAMTGEVEDFEVEVVGLSDLALIKENLTEGGLEQGQQFDYLMTVTNSGPGDAANVIVTDNLPEQVSLVSTSGCLEDPIAVPVCTLGDLPNGESISYTITVQVNDNAGGEIVNTAEVSSDNVDPEAADNTDGATTFVAIEVPALGVWGLMLLAFTLVLLTARRYHLYQ